MYPKTRVLWKRVVRANGVYMSKECATRTLFFLGRNQQSHKKTTFIRKGGVFKTRCTCKRGEYIKWVCRPEIVFPRAQSVIAYENEGSMKTSCTWKRGVYVKAGVPPTVTLFSSSLLWFRCVYQRCVYVNEVCELRSRIRKGGVYENEVCELRSRIRNGGVRTTKSRMKTRDICKRRVYENEVYM